MKKTLAWIIGVGILAFAMHACLTPEADDSVNENAAIKIIKDSHAPSSQLLSWNPDLDDMQWIATRCGSACSDTDTDCYLVTASVDVITLGEKKTLRPEWTVCAGNTKQYLFNTEARMLFDER